MSSVAATVEDAQRFASRMLLDLDLVASLPPASLVELCRAVTAEDPTGALHPSAEALARAGARSSPALLASQTPSQRLQQLRHVLMTLPEPPTGLIEQIGARGRAAGGPLVRTRWVVPGQRVDGLVCQLVGAEDAVPVDVDGRTMLVALAVHQGVLQPMLFELDGHPSALAFFDGRVGLLGVHPTGARRTAVVGRGRLAIVVTWDDAAVCAWSVTGGPATEAGEVDPAGVVLEKAFTSFHHEEPGRGSGWAAVASWRGGHALLSVGAADAAGRPVVAVRQLPADRIVDAVCGDPDVPRGFHLVQEYRIESIRWSADGEDGSATTSAAIAWYARGGHTIGIRRVGRAGVDRAFIVMQEDGTVDLIDTGGQALDLDMFRAVWFDEPRQPHSFVQGCAWNVGESEVGYLLLASDGSLWRGVLNLQRGARPISSPHPFASTLGRFHSIVCEDSASGPRIWATTRAGSVWCWSGERVATEDDVALSPDRPWTIQNVWSARAASHRSAATVVAVTSHSAWLIGPGSGDEPPVITRMHHSVDPVSGSAGLPPSDDVERLVLQVDLQVRPGEPGPRSSGSTRRSLLLVSEEGSVEPRSIGDVRWVKPSRSITSTSVDGVDLLITSAENGIDLRGQDVDVYDLRKCWWRQSEDAEVQVRIGEGAVRFRSALRGGRCVLTAEVVDGWDDDDAFLVGVHTSEGVPVVRRHATRWGEPIDELTLIPPSGAVSLFEPLADVQLLRSVAGSLVAVATIAIGSTICTLIGPVDDPRSWRHGAWYDVAVPITALATTDGPEVGHGAVVLGCQDGSVAVLDISRGERPPR